MIAQEEFDQQQPINVNKEKYSPPILIVLGARREVKGGGIGISEPSCGCGIGS